jgi:hypothetical protein
VSEFTAPQPGVVCAVVNDATGTVLSPAVTALVGLAVVPRISQKYSQLCRSLSMSMGPFEPFATQCFRRVTVLMSWNFTKRAEKRVASERAKVFLL